MLVLPRLAAVVLVMPVLTIGLDLAGLLGMTLVMVGDGIPVTAIAIQVTQWVTAADLYGGLFKAMVFGAAVATIGCRAGMATGVGPRAVGLSATTTYGWGFAVGLMGLASAWLVTTSMAYYTIRKGLVALHKEWMIRAYVVTFAFVTFRILHDYGPTSRLQPENDRSLTISWACWVVPLAITEMIFQLKRVRTAVAARQSS